MSKIRVLISDNHSILRSGIRSLLEVQEDMEVVGEAANGKQAIEMTGHLDPDVVLMDMAMPVIDGLGATRRITRRNPRAKVLMLAQDDYREYALSSIMAGASGYLPKKAGPLELVAAIRAVNQGHRVLQPSVTKWMIKDYLQSVAAGIAERPMVLKEPIYVDAMSKDSPLTPARMAEEVGPIQPQKRLNAQVGGGTVPIPAVLGPLLGLVYILIFPFVVFGTLTRIGGSRAIHSLATGWRKLKHVHVPSQ